MSSTDSARADGRIQSEGSEAPDPVKALPPKGRFAVNVVANVTSFGASLLVGVWLTPYLIRHLGVAAFGLVPLVTTVTAYMGVFTIAFNSAVGRFLTLALDRQDYEEANRIFNTALWGMLILAMLLLGPALLVVSKSHLLFNVPAGYEGQFQWLFLFTIGVFMTTAVGSAFAVSAFWRNRFDLSNASSLAGTFIRVLVIVLLFKLIEPEIWHVGAATLLAALGSLGITVGVWRHLTPMLRIRLSCWSGSTLRQLTWISGWMVVNQVGAILYLGIDLVLINTMIGVEAGGQYGAILVWSLMLRSLAGVLSGVFGPTVFSLYGKGDTPGLVRYSRRAVKFVGLLLALPIGLICGFAEPVLRLWLGPEFVIFAPLLVLLVLPLGVNLAVFPLFTLSLATGRVRVPGVLTCVTGAGNLVLALVLMGPVGWGMYGVAAAGAIMLSLKNLLFTPLYTAHILKVHYASFYREVIPVLASAFGVAVASLWVRHGFQVESLAGLMIGCVILTAAYGASSYFLLLTKEERSAARAMIQLLSNLRPQR